MPGPGCRPGQRASSRRRHFRLAARTLDRLAPMAMVWDLAIKKRRDVAGELAQMLGSDSPKQPA